MICAPCKEAGNLSPVSVNYEHLRRKLHDQCEAPKSCPCQHVLLPIEDVKASGPK